MLSDHRLLCGMSLPTLLLAMMVLSACDSSKPKELNTDLSPTSRPDSKPPIQPPGTASYMAFKTITEEQLGVRIYPGATPRDGGNWQMTDRLSEGAQFQMMATLHSDDAVSKVADFYTRELEIPSAQVLRVPTRDGPKISITIENSAHGTTNVMLQRADDGSGTLIAITRMAGQSDPHPEDRPNH
jgi:hypothetical protein